MSEAPHFEMVSGPGGRQYRRMVPRFTNAFRVGLTAWKLKADAGEAHHPPPPLPIGTETVALVSFVPTGPRDYGDAGPWIERRRNDGRAIIIIPPEGWDPSGNLQDLPGDAMTAISTRDFSQVDAHAAPSRRGFVLYDLKGEWTDAKGKPSGPPASATSAGIPALAGVIGLLGGFSLVVWAWPSDSYRANT